MMNFNIRQRILLLCLPLGIVFVTWKLQVAWVLSIAKSVVAPVKPSTGKEFPNNDAPNIRKTLLMVQYTGGPTYSELLNRTQPINQAYADLWGYDYQSFSGLMIQSELSINETTSNIPESRATYNKVMILERVLTDPSYQKYDMLMILDSDAMMYDFSRDIASILPDSRLIAALKVSGNDLEDDATWNINIGVTVWNLRHRAARPLCRTWKKACIHRIENLISLRDSDQAPLQTILRKISDEDRSKIVWAVPKELGYRHGRWVRHFIRPNAENWTDFAVTMEHRLNGIETTIDEICNKTMDLPKDLNFCQRS